MITVRLAHAADFAAYGGQVELPDDEILERLLKLNHDRAAGQTNGVSEGNKNK